MRRPLAVARLDHEVKPRDASSLRRCDDSARSSGHRVDTGFTHSRLDLLVMGVMICLRLKEPLTLSLMRPILAMLIALSLAFAPVATAWAAAPAKGAAGMTMDGDDGAAVDCAKMGMAVTKSGGGSDCPCCDTKSKCPDMTTCLVKCGTQVIGVVVPAVKLAALTGRHVRPSDPQEPPDWSLRPPAPPPRV